MKKLLLIASMVSFCFLSIQISASFNTFSSQGNGLSTQELPSEH